MKRLITEDEFLVKTSQLYAEIDMLRMRIEQLELSLNTPHHIEPIPYITGATPPTLSGNYVGTYNYTLNDDGTISIDTSTHT